MNYNSLIKETKKALESYSDITAELEELYRKAKKSNQASYETARKSLGEQYVSEKNAAAANARLSENDMYQFLASRGLSSSGESVQAKIDSDISLNKTLSELAKANAGSLYTLEREKLQKDIELENLLAEKKIDLKKEQIELATKLAEKGVSGNKSSTSDGNKTDRFVPETSAKELATFSTDGRVTTALQKSYIKQYLNTLYESENIDSDYIKELIINLKAAGYTDITDTASEAFITSKDGQSFYDRAYEQLYSIFIRGNRSAATASRMAREQAKIQMLDYIYQRCTTIEAFEAACRKINITASELKEYYNRIDNIIKKDKDAIKLGSKTGYASTEQ